MSDQIWPPMVRLLRRCTAALILLGAWQVGVDWVMLP